MYSFLACLRRYKSESMYEVYYHQRSWQYHIRILKKNMSQMFILKRSGPNNDPCGTPHAILA